MRIIADLQIHSKYSRACSQDLTPKNIGHWADKKGIAVIGTGDFTHPKWLSELKNALEETRPGLYQLKDKSARAYFMLTSEISSIYKQGEKLRRQHTCVFAPNFTAVDKFIEGLESQGANLKSDGRPITGIHCDELVKIALAADSRNFIVPAHVWTPHFGAFGSLSGFDSIAEAFGDQAKHIFAIETGLSSDPKMNWQISALDKYTLVSNSDAHSLRKIGREANVFDIPEKDLSYDSIIDAIKSKDPRRFLFTIEFFPEEGKYHLDGHADCKFSCEPEKTRKLGGKCPVCGKKLLVGVLSRVAELADREYGFVPPEAIPFKNIIPLEEIIAETFNVGAGSKRVLETYNRMTDKNPEFEILLDLPESEIAKISATEIATAILRVREGKVRVEGGYDGVFGKIHIFSDEERDKVLRKPKQMGLF
ncbi:MAG: endonuclease Q family protein [Patescibacteria group bacterium]|nr:endonuclease Q family protein [Patescibacteria group bacterium]